MPPPRLRSAFPARTFVFAASVVDFFAIYLSTSMPIQVQWNNSQAIYRSAIGIGVLLGLIDMVSVNLFYGPEMARKAPCCPVKVVEEDDLEDQLSEKLLPRGSEESQESQEMPIPQETPADSPGSGSSQSPPPLPSKWRAWLANAYLPCSILKSLLDYTYFTYSLFGWIAEWSQLDSKLIPAITTSLTPLTIWQIGLTVASYFLLVFPLYATSDLQETCDTIAGKPDRSSPLRHSQFFKQLTIRVCPYSAALVRNLPQLVFFSPRLVWNILKPYWGIPIAALYLAVWAKNVFTSYQMIQNFDLQTAKVNLEIPTTETYIRVSRFSRLCWGSSQNMERSLAFAMCFKVKTLAAHAVITAAAVVVACLPVYALSLVGKENVLRPDEGALTTTRTTPSLGPPLATEPVFLVRLEMTPSPMQ